jgi:hypothetical protein
MACERRSGVAYDCSTQAKWSCVAGRTGEPKSFAGLSPSGLPLGLDNLQAFDLTSKRGWAGLIQELAILSQYLGKVEDSALDELAHAMAGRPDVISAKARGRTLELRNSSDQPVLALSGSTSLAVQPGWLTRLPETRGPAESRVVVRPSGEPELVLELSWAGAHGVGRATIPLPGAPT